jgi:hypothetical protein
LQKAQKALSKVGTVALARACGEEPLDKTDVWVLTPCLKLLKKGVSTGKTHMVVPAWAAKQKTFQGECSMSRVDFQVDVVHTFAHGDSMQHATSSAISVPVFRNFIAVNPGDELVVHWDNTQAITSISSKSQKGKTWKSNLQKAPSQETVKVKTRKDLVDKRSTNHVGKRSTN